MLTHSDKWELWNDMWNQLGQDLGVFTDVAEIEFAKHHKLDPANWPAYPPSSDKNPRNRWQGGGFRSRAGGMGETEREVVDWHQQQKQHTSSGRAAPAVGASDQQQQHQQGGTVREENRPVVIDRFGNETRAPAQPDASSMAPERRGNALPPPPPPPPGGAQ